MATILLTGAGGAAIPDLIRHLKSLGHRVLTCDMNPQAPGLYLGDGGFVVAPGDDPYFRSALLRISEAELVDVVIPLVDEELLNVHDVKQFVSPRTHILAPSPLFVARCLDKGRCTNALAFRKMPVPYTLPFREERTDFPYPGIVKPKTGHGSRGVIRLNSERDLWQACLDRRLEFSDDYIIQEYIDGPEYTVSVVCDQYNTVHAVVPKEIIRKESSTRLAVTRRNEKIDALCRRIAEALNPCGPFNVQLRLRDGEPFVFEINPRFSGTVNLTIAAGCDEVGGLIELALGRPYTFGEWREGVILVRQTHDAVMDEAEFQRKAPRRWDA